MQAMVYDYDQLHRIVQARSLSGYGQNGFAQRRANQKKKRVYDSAAIFGFTKNYQGTSGSLTGVTKVGGHKDHGHLGLQHNSLNWEYVPAVWFRGCLEVWMDKVEE
ncbi:MAG: hypothetical protein WD426_00025 [Anditalea sp.]